MMLEEPAQIIKGILYGHKPRELLIFALRLFFRSAYNRPDSRQNEYVLRRPSEPDSPLFHILIECLRFLKGLLPGEYGIRFFGGQILPVFRRAGLEDHRLPLLGAGNIQRSLHREELSLVVQRMQLLRIEEDSRLFIPNERIIFP
ncbi:hypothetical protein D3C85_1341910 [compost metagenome]